MQQAIDHFRENLRRVRDVGVLAASLSTLTAPIVDVSDILRSQIVLVVSALDHFVHELVRLGLLECYAGNRPMTSDGLDFGVSLAAVQQAVLGVPHSTWLSSEIRERNSYRTFQQPDKIADAVRLFSTVKLWSAVATHLNQNTNVVRAELGAIVTRRNQIAHEADLDPANPGQRLPISKPMVDGAVQMIERIGEAMYAVVV